MAILSFLAGLPPFWILKKSQSALPYLVTLTSGLLLSTCINIVLPEALANLSEKSLHSAILGPQILLGFILLYSIDVFSSSFSKYYSNDSLHLDLENDLAINREFNLDISNSNTSSIKSYLFSVISNSTTFGLLLHCLTDGIILTTSILSEEANPDDSNGFLIILAIFIHKLPAAFSLTSILLNQKLKNGIILFHLFLFAISAPIGAWLTFFLAKVFKLTDNESSTAFIMLFSTGAFLYVSFHTFISSHTHGNNSNKPGDLSNSKPNWNFLITIIGMLIPLLASLIHDD